MKRKERRLNQSPILYRGYCKNLQGVKKTDKPSHDDLSANPKTTNVKKQINIYKTGTKIGVVSASHNNGIPKKWLTIHRRRLATRT